MVSGVDELNARYGAPGRIVFHIGHGGYPEAVLANKYGSAEVALLGGIVLSYRPTGHSPVLFRGERRDYNRGEEVHGGIPVCWPQFGNRFSKELPPHGFAKMLVFKPTATEYSEEVTELTLALKSDSETLKLWPHEFELELKISVSMKLNLQLTTKNTGKAPFMFSAGFHPYLRVRNRDDVVLKGLDGLKYFNGVSNTPDEVLNGDLVMNQATDHIFALKPEPRHESALIDNGLGRAIAMASSGNTKMVVWNPGPGKKMADLADDDWKKFVCVEPVTEWPGGSELKPGESHQLLAAIQSTIG